MTAKPPSTKVPAADHSQRIDKWLWFIRATKTRTLATSLVANGKVRVNRRKISKPSHPVEPGDVITLALQGNVRVVQVLAAGARRGPASEAATLYTELTEQPAGGTLSSQGEPSRAQNEPPAPREPGTGRPTKRERRQLDQLHRRTR